MNVQARVPRGIPAGGQFAAVQHPEPALGLHDEHRQGMARVLELERLPRQRTSREARELTEQLRLAYGAYTEVPTDEGATVPAALRRILDELAPLGPDRAGHWADLIGFAVSTEMRHWEDPEYAARPEHDFEQLITPSDYREDQQATDANRERWEALANLAAHHALTEAHDAAQTALPKAA